MTRHTHAPIARARSALLGITVALTLLLTTNACGQPAEPARWDAQTIDGFDIPAIDWPLGAPDMSDEHTALVINVEIAFAVAFNTHDFSDPYLTSIITEDYLQRRLSNAVGNTGVSDITGLTYYPYHPGPRPVRVTRASTDNTTGDLTITICTYSWSRWTDPRRDPITADAPVLEGNGAIATYVFEDHPVHGLRLADMGGTADLCKADTLQTGFFDPPPPYDQIVEDDELLDLDGQPAQQ